MIESNHVVLFGSLVFAVMGGWISRMCGGGKPKLPWGLDQWIYAIPHGIVGYLATQQFGWWAVAGTLGAYFCAFIFKRTGHGQYFDLGFTTKLMQNEDGSPRVERIDFILKWLMGVDPNNVREGPGSFRRDYLGMCVSGLLIALGTSIALLTGGYWQLAIITAVAGFTKGLWYVIGKFQEKWGFEGFGLKLYNEHGEFWTGYWDYWSLALAIAIISGW